MIQRFCDACGREMTKEVGRIKRTAGDISVEVMVGWRGVWNTGDVCRSCVLRIVADAPDEEVRID